MAVREEKGISTLGVLTILSFCVVLVFLGVTLVIHTRSAVLTRASEAHRNLAASVQMARSYYEANRTLDGLSSTPVAWHWVGATTDSDGPNHLSVVAAEGEMVAVAATTHQTCRAVLYLEAGTVLSYIGWYVEGPAPEAPPPDTTEIAAPPTSALYYGQYPAQLGCSATTGLQAVEVWGTQW